MSFKYNRGRGYYMAIFDAFFWPMLPELMSFIAYMAYFTVTIRPRPEFNITSQFPFLYLPCAFLIISQYLISLRHFIIDITAL